MKSKPTKFQLAVWKACAKIPKGKVATYSEIARAIGKPRAVRAVGNALSTLRKNVDKYCRENHGNALNKNPHAPKVPCHRVIRSDGSVGGFAHGTKKKIEMLMRERVKIKNGKILSPNILLYLQ